MIHQYSVQGYVSRYAANLIGCYSILMSAFRANGQVVFTKMQGMAIFTYPTFLLSGVAHDQSVRSHVFCNNRSCGNESIFPDGVPTNDRRISSNTCTFFNESLLVLMLAW